jgi:hypothetical protein
MAARRLAAAAGAILGTLALGMVVRPALPALGRFHDGPAGSQMKVPLGWRRAGSSADRASFSNGLTGGFRSSATLLTVAACSNESCACDRVVRRAIEDDLWRLADVGPFKSLQLATKPRVEGTLEGAEGQARVSAVCVPGAALIVMQPIPGSATLADRMAGTIVIPPK